VPNVVYRANTGRGSALEQIGRNADMRRHMARVGDQAADVARRNARFPSRVGTATELKAQRGGYRWSAIVRNSHRGARFEEYGGCGWEPLPHPLGKALDAVAAADPNRRRGRRLTR